MTPVQNEGGETIPGTVNFDILQFVMSVEEDINFQTMDDDQIGSIMRYRRIHPNV